MVLDPNLNLPTDFWKAPWISPNLSVCIHLLPCNTSWKSNWHTSDPFLDCPQKSGPPWLGAQFITKSTCICWYFAFKMFPIVYVWLHQVDDQLFEVRSHMFSFFRSWCEHDTMSEALHRIYISLLKQMLQHFAYLQIWFN